MHAPVRLCEASPDETLFPLLLSGSGSFIAVPNGVPQRGDSGCEFGSVGLPPSRPCGAGGNGMNDNKKRDANPDPITGEPGAHPVGVAGGATGGAVTGAAIGALGGPVGSAVGGA